MFTSGELTKSKILSQYIALLRPHHWIKNSFIFLPLFFAGEVFNIGKLFDCFAGFFAFSFIASSIYVVNDYMDIENDRKHPDKCTRPLASGAVSKNSAITLFLITFFIGVGIAILIKPKFLFVLMLYFLMNIGYSLGLKNIAILDIVMIAIGFVLRIKAGGVISMIAISHWLMIMVFLLALFMAVGKRRDDLLIKIDSGVDMRKSMGSHHIQRVCLYKIYWKEF